MQLKNTKTIIYTFELKRAIIEMKILLEKINSTFELAKESLNLQLRLSNLMKKLRLPRWR